MKDQTLAQVLSARWGINQTIVKKWLDAHEIKNVADLMKFGSSHAEAMDKALNDLWLNF